MTVRAVRLPLSLLVELIWSFAAVALLVAVLGRGDGPSPSLLGVGAVVIGSFGLARALQQTDLGDAQFRTLGAATSVLALAAIVYLEYGRGSPPWDIGWFRTLVTDAGGHAHVIAASVVLTALWMRGIVRGQQTLDSDSVTQGVALGFVPVAIAAGVAPDVHGPNVFGLLAIIYLLAALAVLALYQAPNPDRPLRAFAAQWGVAAIGVVAIAAVLKVVAAAIDPGALGALAPVGERVGAAAVLALTYTIGPPLALIGWLFSFIPLPDRQQDQQPQPTPAPDARPEDDQNGAPMWARVLGWVLAGSAGTLIVAGAIAVLWSLFRRYAKRKEDDGDRRESVEAELSLGSELGAAFDALARRFRRGPRSAASSVEVRRLYHEMLATSAAAGIERPAAATPLQFAPQLDAHYASSLPTDISQAFTASRYGAHDIDESSVTDLRARWRTLDAGSRR